jgi:2-polyprenyl-6-methoxyphenol hydroxylase-like FAD-dependent oxidoreductase
MISSLRKAVHLEELRGTVNLHSGKGFQIASIYERSIDPWAAPLVLKDNEQTTARDYHLIIAADGMNSRLRKMYGGHIYKRHHLTGATALPSPLEIPNNTPTPDWDVMGQAEATGTQDRNYTIFRGNANMSTEETDLGVSFQTWGERRSMRFATVPMYYPDPKAPGKRCERQVWFATTNDEAIAAEKDPAVRRDMLLENFKDWHDPVCRLMEATGPDDILMERAVAHKHCMGPVVNFNDVIKKIRNVQPPSSGNGPAIVFMGDAFMCIDPILAQGFTIGMEGAAALAKSIDQSLKEPKRSEIPQLAFDPDALRDELKLRHERRLGRLIHLLRATELVQALGQPTSGTLSGFITRAILRPLMRITPAFIKTPIFNSMLKYSLGLPHGKTKHQEQETKQ